MLLRGDPSCFKGKEDVIISMVWTMNDPSQDIGTGVKKWNYRQSYMYICTYAPQARLPAQQRFHDVAYGRRGFSLDIIIEQVRLHSRSTYHHRSVEVMHLTPVMTSCT